MGGDTYPTVRGAAVQAAPVFLDREATTDKACALIREAGANGARVIGFPEGFIPAHPIWFYFHAASSPTSVRLGTELFRNAVEVPGPTTASLGAAARHADAYVVMGVCEKAPGSISGLYNTQLFFGPDGRLIGKHQKLMPTLGERLVHRGGYGDTMRTVATDFGPISGLICGENSNPLALFALAAEQTRVHVAAWPNLGSKTRSAMPETSMNRGKAVADITRAFVINSCGVVDDTVRDALDLTGDDLAHLNTPQAMGGSAIIGPDMSVVAGPLLGPDEGIVYGDMHLEHLVRMKLRQDYAGHYNRPDVFRLQINRHAPSYIDEVNTGLSPAGATSDEAPGSDGAGIEPPVAARHDGWTSPTWRPSHI